MPFILQMLHQVVDNLFYYGTLSIITIHSLEAKRYTIDAKRSLQLSYPYNIGLTILCPFVYYYSIFSNAWVTQKKFIYGILRFEKIQWILDSVLSRKALCQRWKNATWKSRILVGFGYSFGIWYFYRSIFWCYKVYTIPMIVTTIVNIAWDLIYPYTIKSFQFENLPFSFQQRFYQLQSPIMKYQISKAFFSPALAPYYNQLQIEYCFIRNGSKCHEIFEALGSSSKYYSTSITLCCSPDKICTCPKPALKKTKVLKRIFVKCLSENALSASLSLIDCSSVLILYICDCALSQQDFEIIPTMKLKYLTLCLRNDNQSFDEKMGQVFNYVIGIPHLRIQYVGEVWNSSLFEIFLVQWVIENGYVDSLVCSANNDFFRSHTVFASCQNISIFDTVDDEIEEIIFK